MKLITKIVAVTCITCAATGMQSCYKVATVPLNNKQEITTPVSFATDLQPLLTANCAISGCHSSGGHIPDLTAEKSYNAITSGGYVNTGAPENSGLYLWLTGKKGTPMPPGSSNPGNINNLALAWIQQGAQNN